VGIVAGRVVKIFFEKPIDGMEPLSYCPMTVMMLQINFKSGKPVYLQVVDQVKAAAAAGAVQAGELLPSIRPLAEELRVNRNTIAKAYGELEAQGVIETVAGKGSFIKANHSPLKKDIRRKLLAEEIDQVVVQAHHLQVPPTEFLELVRLRLEAMDERRRASEPPKPDRAT
jgi:GntR family transcriptional regulator